MSEVIYCFSYFQAKDNYREQLITALQQLIAPTRLEEGCLEYELLTDINDPNLLIMFEKFVSPQALAEHEEQPYIKSFVASAMERFCEKVSWHEAREVTADSKNHNR
jgi:quinol monooxygenase YgiN